MKHFVPFVIVALLAALVLFRQASDITQLPRGAYFEIYYTATGEQAHYSEDTIAYAVRFFGGESEAQEAMRGMGARILLTQRVGDTTIFYAYTPRLGATARLSFGRVNLMVAVTDNTITAASPLIYGGY